MRYGCKQVQERVPCDLNPLTQHLGTIFSSHKLKQNKLAPGLVKINYRSAST